MSKIQYVLGGFANDLDYQPSIHKQQIGAPTVHSRLDKIFFELLHLKNSSLDKNKIFCRFLDSLERKVVVFNGSKNEIENQKSCFASCVKTANVIKHQLKGDKSIKAHEQLNHLARRVAGLNYRIEASNGGFDPVDIDPLLQDKIVRLAIEWKSDHPLFFDKNLTDKDKRKIAEVCKYPKFAKILLGDKGLRKTFFVWALRDNGEVRQFIQYPSMTNHLKAVFLASRIGRLGEDILRIEKKERKEGGEEKILSLPFHTVKGVERINIMDESKVIEMNQGWKVKIKQIFDVFAKKNTDFGDFEIFGSTGIDVWNCSQIGRWNHQTKKYDRVDLSQENWWNELPVLEEITKTDLERKYNTELAEGEWLVCGKASRQTADLDFNGQHGFLEVAIPTPSGTYRIYPFGNFAEKFPATTVELLYFLANTVKGKISYPDENFFYLQRQQASYPIPLSVDEGKRLMQKIGEDLIRASKGYLVFQLASENCAFWAQQALDVLQDTKSVPNLYKMKVIHTTPKDPLFGKLFPIVRKLPEKVGLLILKSVDIIFGSWRGVTILHKGNKIFKSHMSSQSRDEGFAYQPGFLHEQIIKKRLKGVISFG